MCEAARERPPCLIYKLIVSLYFLPFPFASYYLEVQLSYLLFLIQPFSFLLPPLPPPSFRNKFHKCHQIVRKTNLPPTFKYLEILLKVSPLKTMYDTYPEQITLIFYSGKYYHFNSITSGFDSNPTI